ncbi:hypothetical protein B0H10DRAFT_1998820 [Mycena sp. CBHHK59/15]|nr:hypothetical protein B0H10DRAFT_2122779 [Mycena sp. CBHHK59/15]KAJ6626290.1 hypothetical protein B0H10DRAFT_1998820 [Mycena sp. CBHHK59/15]
MRQFLRCEGAVCLGCLLSMCPQIIAQISLVVLGFLTKSHKPLGLARGLAGNSLQWTPCSCPNCQRFICGSNVSFIAVSQHIYGAKRSTYHERVSLVSSSCASCLIC